MLNQPTIEKLQAMKLHGMADAFRQQIETPDSSQLSLEERFGLLVDHQWLWKENHALTRRLQLARFSSRSATIVYQRRSTILTSQMPIAHWHEQIGDPSI